MTELSEIRGEVGYIRASIDESTRQREAIFKKLDTLGDKMSEAAGAIRTVSQNHEALAARVNSEVMPVIEDMKNTKQRAIGVLTGVTVVSGSIGALVAKGMAKFMGPG